MVFTLLISLAATTVTGIALLAVQENAGPLSPWLGQGASLEKNSPESARFTGQAYASDDDEERNGEEGERSRDEKGDALKEIHEFLSNLTLFLVIIHIGGVVLASFVHRENLARAMITGRKRP
jgi:cytochrome b